jgi:DNA-binding response OmpR family regulator
MARVLIVEDDDAMARALSDGFTFEGHSVTLARDGQAGLRLALEQRPDLVILDIMLPRLSGLDVCRRLREQKIDVPVIMLTARGQEIDKVVGLRSGADDYVTKPFSFMELLARADAVLRRARPGTVPRGPVRFGDVEVDFDACEARRAGEAVELSGLELRLLQYLLEHKGQVLSRDRLLSAVWGYDDGAVSRTVDVHVAKLRKKLERRPEDPRHIVTVHGLGYKFLG